MKIGILTYHRSHNYGALLQAIALRKIVSDLGYEVRFIDYWPDYHKKLYTLINLETVRNGSLSNRLLNIAYQLITFPYKYQRFKRFLDFIEHQIAPYTSPTTEKWDIVMCGSDQIWRKQGGLNNNYNPTYFGAGEITASTYISYAASMGVIDATKQEQETLKGWLDKFSHISVREEELRQLVQQCGIEEVVTVADPTLLITKKEWTQLIGGNQLKDKSKYVLVYELHNGSFDRNTIKEYAKNHGYEIKVLRGKASIESYKSGTITSADPFDMIRLIAGAEMIFTSSYHGLVFSIIYERPFVASFKYNSGRAYSLLTSLGLMDRLVPVGITEFPTEDIDYPLCNKRLNILRTQSINWLKIALSTSV